jgi:TonB family protein
LLTLFALLAAMQPVGMKGHADWIRADDYPRSARQRGEAGYVGFSILVGPDGKTERCDVTAPSPYSDLNDLTCSLIMRRARFTPAVGSDGQPAYGLFRSWSSWFSADSNASMEEIIKSHPLPSSIDLTLFVQTEKLPDSIDLIVSVSASGTIGECQPKTSPSPSSLAHLACEQLKSQWKPATAATVSGGAVPTVQTARVSFKAGDAAEKRP